MKKAILLSCMLTASLVASAQLANTKQLSATTSPGKAVRIEISKTQLSKKMARPTMADATMKSQVTNKAPRLSKENGVYYNRPSGSYTCGLTRSWGGWTADFVFGLPLGENEFENACTEPEKAKWSIITSTQTIDMEGEEGTNNLIYEGYTYDQADDTYDNGFSLYYTPTITVGQDSYTWGETNENGGAFGVAGRPSPFTKAPIGSLYSGWSGGGNIYGTGADIDFDFDDDGVDEHYSLDGFWQLHEAPLSPLYVEDIYILGRLGNDPNNPDETPSIPATIPEDTELHLFITNVMRDENGRRWPGDEVIADLTCSANDIEPVEYDGKVVGYSFVFSNKEIDIIGTESVVPFVLDQEYAISLNWAVEGVNINIAGTDMDEESVDEYSVQPSFMILTNDAGETNLTTLRYTGVTITPVFEAMFDYAAVYDVLYGSDGTTYYQMNVLTAPDAGGKIWEQEDNNINTFAYANTALSWFDESESENYYFEELPEWITDYAVQEDTEGENASGFTFISFEVEPLPEGISGRMAEIYIKGRGFKAETPIVVLQGDATYNPYVKEITDGKYLLINLAAEKCWGAGNDWGTRASLIDNPEYVTLLKQPDGAYHMETQVSNGGTSYYFGGDYMDGQPIALNFTPSAQPIGEDEDGKPLYAYLISTADGEYFGYDGQTTVLGKKLNITTEDGYDNALWLVVSEEDALEAINSASVEDPSNVTFFILDPNFGRNNRNFSAWTGENFKKGGDNTNQCVESYHTDFTMSQTLTNVPNGVYALTAQGFYRQDGEDNNNLPEFFINDESETFPVKTGAENSMNDASASFGNGAYTTEPIYVEVEDGTITLGAKLVGNANLWCIWDNFVLTYYGADASVKEIKMAILAEKLQNLRTQAKEMQELPYMTETAKEILKAALDATKLVNTAKEAEVKAAIQTLEDAIAEAERLTKAAKILYEGGIIPDNSLEGWTCTTGNSFEINTWSVEGNEGNDPSGMVVPFIQSWVSKPGPLGVGQLFYTLENVPADTYSVTALVRLYSESGEEPAGADFFVNDAKANIADYGYHFDYNNMKGVYGNFGLSTKVGDDGILKFGVDVTAPNFNWVAIKNVKIQQGVPTGIQTIDTQNDNRQNVIYNLNGQKVKNAQKGLYIMNGKKVVIK